MAEIEIERRPRRNGWTWFALLLVLAGVAIGAWLIFGNGIDTSADARPAAETTSEEQFTEPVAPLDEPREPTVSDPDVPDAGDDDGTTAPDPTAPGSDPDPGADGG